MLWRTDKDIQDLLNGWGWVPEWNLTFVNKSGLLEEVNCFGLVLTKWGKKSFNIKNTAHWWIIPTFQIDTVVLTPCSALEHSKTIAELEKASNTNLLFLKQTLLIMHSLFWQRKLFIFCLEMRGRCKMFYKPLEWSKNYNIAIVNLTVFLEWTIEIAVPFAESRKHNLSSLAQWSPIR